MNFKKFLLPIMSIPILPIVLLSSCGTVGENDPIKLDGTVISTNNKNGFNNLFNLLKKQNQQNSFIQKNTNEINNLISDKISTDKALQEKLRIYFFVSIYNSLDNVSDIIDGDIQQIQAIGERENAVNNIKKMITDLSVDNFLGLTNEINKITDMKIILQNKEVGGVQNLWTWETSFKLAEDSELRKILKIQKDLGDGKYVDNSVFYRRSLSQEEYNTIRKEATTDAGFDQLVYDKIVQQKVYESSKWYWDGKDNTIKSIKKESNLNTYANNGTNGGFTSEDIKRTTFTIDFLQDNNNIKLYQPIFLFKTKKTISSYISFEWRNYLKMLNFEKQDNNSNEEQYLEKNKDITVNLNCSFVEYDKKI